MVILCCIENGILGVLIKIASMRRFLSEHTTYLHAKENRKISVLLRTLYQIWIKIIQYFITVNCTLGFIIECPHLFKYNQPSLSRLRLSRITAYLEEKI